MLDIVRYSWTKQQNIEIDKRDTFKKKAATSITDKNQEIYEKITNQSRVYTSGQFKCSFE